MLIWCTSQYNWGCWHCFILAILQYKNSRHKDNGFVSKGHYSYLIHKKNITGTYALTPTLLGNIFYSGRISQRNR